jgi:sterol desaturase/sphingolipid hydroxylase (fatty acid hydroxylase superfamily)
VPTLIELFTDPISLAFFGLYAALWGLEALFPARVLPPIPGHRMRALCALGAYFLVSSYLPYWVSPLLEPLRIADLSSLGTWGGGLCALLVYQTFAYAWHRSMHRFDALFRAVHQLHHSAERLDVPSAFLFGPFDMIGWTLVSTVALSLVGVTPAATVAFVLGTSFLSTFQHANVRTPRWLGYLIQRPESHSHHHARGVHADNYADLPIFDMLFGTFENPASFAPATGYYDGASARIGDMLMLRDVSAPKSLAPESLAPGRRQASRALADATPQRSKAPAVLRGSQSH